MKSSALWPGCRTNEVSPSAVSIRDGQSLSRTQVQRADPPFVLEEKVQVKMKVKYRLMSERRGWMGMGLGGRRTREKEGNKWMHAMGRSLSQPRREVK